jgi:hypothetical protein
MNQWAFKHSALNLPLKLSMNALSGMMHAGAPFPRLVGAASLF